MQVGTSNVLRGQQQQEEKGQVGCGVTDELDEGLLDEVSQSALRSQQVDLTGKERDLHGWLLVNILLLVNSISYLFLRLLLSSQRFLVTAADNSLATGLL